MKITLNLKLLVILFLLILLHSCTEMKPNYRPKEGDILFQDLDCGNLCAAIKRVTFGKDSAEFSHIGLVQKIDEKWKVLEAISEGVKYTNLVDFFKRSLDENNHPKIWVGRLKPQYSDILEKIEQEIPDYLNLPYDDAFLMNNGKYYCSELIFELFKKANGNKPFFELEPMTYKDPNTGEFLSVWVDYYKQLNMEIPEGLPGINPAGISRSNKIEMVRKLGKVSLKYESSN